MSLRKRRKTLPKLRKVGDIMLDMEPLLVELTDVTGHDMQWGEVRSLVMAWLEIHAPHAREEYLDGSHPIDYYGPEKYK